MQIDKKLYEEINEYCKLNDLKTRDFIHKLLKESFLKEKFGESPFQQYRLTSNIEDNVEPLEKVDTEPDVLTVYEVKEESIVIDTAEKVYNDTIGSKITPFIPLTEEVKPKKKRKLK